MSADRCISAAMLFASSWARAPRTRKGSLPVSGGVAMSYRGVRGDNRSEAGDQSCPLLVVGSVPTALESCPTGVLEGEEELAQKVLRTTDLRSLA